MQKYYIQDVLDHVYIIEYNIVEPYGIPLEIRNTFDPNTDNKTVISNCSIGNNSKILGVVSV